MLKCPSLEKKHLYFLVIINTAIHLQINHLSWLLELQQLWLVVSLFLRELEG